MTSKEFLSQAYLIDQQINSKLERLEQLRGFSTSVTASYGQEQVDHTCNTHAMQDTIVRILQEEEEINRYIDRLFDLKMEISRVIDQVRKPEYHLVLEQRYLCFRSWKTIADKYNFSLRWVHTLHDRALKVVDKIRSESSQNV